MNFLLDHDVPADVGRILSGSNHRVDTVAKILPATATDEEVFNAAVEREQILVTCNRDDFLALARDRRHLGLIILVRRRTRIAEAAALLRLIERAGAQGLSGNVNFA